MKKKVLSLLGIAAGMCLMTGCFPMGETMTGSGDAPDISAVVGENPDITVSADYPETSTKEYHLIKAKVMQWDEEKMNKTFLSDRFIKEHKSNPDKFDEENILQVYKGDDYWLVYEYGRFVSEQQEKISAHDYGTLLSIMNLSNAGAFFTDDEISSFPKEDAVKLTKPILESVGLTNLDEAHIYAVTADKANEVLAKLKDDAEKPNNSDVNEKGHITYHGEWSADEEIYIVDYQQQFEGIPVSTDSPDTGANIVYVGSSVQAIVAKDDVLSIEGMNLYSPDYEVGEKVELSCSAESAAAVVADYYDKTYAELYDKCEICGVKLVYVPYPEDALVVREYTLHPVWQVDVAVRSALTDVMDDVKYEYVDAQTGKLVDWS